MFIPQVTQASQNLFKKERISITYIEMRKHSTAVLKLLIDGLVK